VYNPVVRVKSEVEELVREIAKSLGYSAFSVRNTAILYGLISIKTLGVMPKKDAEFLELLEKVSKLAGKSITTHGSGRRYIRKTKRG